MLVQVVSSQSVKDNSALTDTNMQASLHKNALSKGILSYHCIGWIGVLAAAAMQLTSQPSQQSTDQRV